MKIRDTINIAKFATSAGWLQEKDWKTLKILSGDYKRRVVKKGICHAAKDVISIVTAIMSKGK